MRPAIMSGSVYRVVRQTYRVFADASGGMVSEVRLMSGERYRRTREITDRVEMFRPTMRDPAVYRLEDGHLPAFQPRVSGEEAEERILADPWLSAVEIGKAVTP